MKTSASPLCVLLVDDDEDSRVLTRRLVEKADSSATVVAVQGAREAMDYLLRASSPVNGSTRMPTVMFLDLNMPEMNGFELLRWIRRHPSLAGVKVIMLSSSEAGSDVKKASELGAHGYLIKYPNASCLANLLKQAADSRTPFPTMSGDNGSSRPHLAGPAKDGAPRGGELLDADLRGMSARAKQE